MGEHFIGTQLMPDGYESFTLWRKKYGDPIADAETLSQFALDLQAMADSGFYNDGTARSLRNAVTALEGLYIVHPDVQVPYSQIEDILIEATEAGIPPLSYLEVPVYPMIGVDGTPSEERYSVDFNSERRETEEVSHAMVNTMLFLIEQHPLHVEKGQCLVVAKEATAKEEAPSAFFSWIQNTLQSHGIGNFVNATSAPPQCSPVNRNPDTSETGRSS